MSNEINYFAGLAASRDREVGRYMVCARNRRSYADVSRLLHEAALRDAERQAAYRAMVRVRAGG